MLRKVGAVQGCFTLELPPAPSSRLLVVAFCPCVSLLAAHDRREARHENTHNEAQELPGEFTTFDFLEGIPAPFNFGLSILLNQSLVQICPVVSSTFGFS